MSTATSIFKPLSIPEGCLTSLPTLFTSKPSHPFLPHPSKPIKLLSLSSSSCCSSSHPSFVSLKKKFSSQNLIALVASTSDWAPQQDEESEVGEGLNWEDQQGGETEAGASDWEGEGESRAEEEESSGDGYVEEESYPDPPEDAKLFVGNLPYDMDSQNLAELFEKAGTVEVAEVIYSKDTNQSRGFGFVSMSTVEDAEKAVEMFQRLDVNGRLLTVNKAAPRGSRVERSPRQFGPSFRIYVGNLPWQVDDARLEQVFSEHGKVVEARVIYDRETGRSRGFGFVTFSSQTELDDAIAALDGQSVDGRAIRVNVAEDRPRRGAF